nr:MAG TPA: hypothetical protein [Caudoviricetes sp.]
MRWRNNPWFLNRSHRGQNLVSGLLLLWKSLKVQAAGAARLVGFTARTGAQWFYARI